jgi:hypothetical protein
MSAANLFALFQRISSTTYSNEISFVIDAIPNFVRTLGYRDDWLLFEHRLAAQQYIADAVVTSSPAGPPRLLIEAKSQRFSGRHMYDDGEAQLLSYQEVSNAEFAVLFAPHLLWILRNGVFQRFDLRTITSEQASDIYEQLRRPDGWPNNLPPTTITPAVETREISFPYFTLSRESLVAALDAVTRAETSHEKGKSLESLGAMLFGGLNGIAVKYRNLLGASSEIDIVVEYNRTVFNPAFDEFGRYALIECKNWESSVGAKHVRDFKVKLDKTKVRLGFLLARNGVTGAHDGADALREIHSTMDRDGVFIIVVTLDDISSILAGADFYQIIDDRIDRLRFDL